MQNTRQASHAKPQPGITIRLATSEDLPAVNAIYNHYVRTSLCTYQEEESTMEERREWFAQRDASFPVTIAEREGRIVGWGSLSRFRDRSGYRFSVENSVYAHSDCLGQGIGKALLIDQIARAKASGFRTIIAGCDSLQTASIAMHEKAGFVRAAHFKNVGFKFGQWLDVIFLQLML